MHTDIEKQILRLLVHEDGVSFEDRILVYVAELFDEIHDGTIGGQIRLLVPKVLLQMIHKGYVIKDKQYSQTAYRILPKGEMAIAPIWKQVRFYVLNDKNYLLQFLIFIATVIGVFLAL